MLKLAASEIAALRLFIIKNIYLAANAVRCYIKEGEQAAMAFYLEKQSTGSTPYVLIDEENKLMRFEGQSFHEDIIAFFSDVNSWLDAYLES